MKTFLFRLARERSFFPGLDEKITTVVRGIRLPSPWGGEDLFKGVEILAARRENQDIGGGGRMASGSQETMAELLHGVEPVEPKSLFPTFFHDALQERMGQVGGRDNEDVELS